MATFPDQRRDTTPPVNQPDQPYGARTELERLAEALGQQAPAVRTGENRPYLERPSAKVPAPPPQRTASPPPGIPAAVLAPTDRPEVPVNTPLVTAPPMAQPAPDQARLALLDRLRSSPSVSPTTREWARLLIEEILAS